MTRKVAATAPTETEVMRQVLDAMRLFGVDCDRQNTAAFYNPSGQFVRCGEPGASDIAGQFTSGPARGKRIHVEVKKPGFDPRKLKGEKRAHFDRQLARLRKTNEGGGFGLWATDPAQVVHAIERINAGWRIVIDDDGFPYATDEDG